ncbi:hypothetical protein F5890DRAFT_727024 [Lentinula detonsa]|uniref:ABC1 atypical kinase-like domain-containing protein n=1 Tax=Lentinula detonsa TaxID=2804962 RepID=A0AA38UNN6_9AGAR|nr:hypothetical protein F5890DRAFT_727024 [Lentinula detonsa]
MTRSFLILPLIASLCITFPAFTHAAPTAFQNVTNSQLEARNVPGILSKAEILREHDRKWILGVYGEDLDYKRTNIFTKTLPIHTRISNSDLPPRLDEQGEPLERSSNTEIRYVLDNDGHNIGVAKGYLSNQEMDKWEAHAEVQALKATAKSRSEYDYGKKYGWPVANDFRPVIVMNYVKGVDIVDSEQYRNAPIAKKQKMQERYKKLLRDEVYHYVKKGILHTDFHSGNVRVTFDKRDKIEQVKLIDWGYPGVFTVDKKVSKEDFKQWFDKRFDYCYRRQ